MLLVGFDPGLDPVAHSAFLNRQGVPPGPHSTAHGPVPREAGGGITLRLVGHFDPAGADSATEPILIEEWAVPPGPTATSNSAFSRRSPIRHAWDPTAWVEAPPTPGSPDTDTDGLPDDWEAAFGFDARSSQGADGGNADPDGDSFSNRLECLNGTNPRDPASRLALRTHLAEWSQLGSVVDAPPGTLVYLEQWSLPLRLPTPGFKRPTFVFPHPAASSWSSHPHALGAALPGAAPLIAFRVHRGTIPSGARQDCCIPRRAAVPRRLPSVLFRRVQLAPGRDGALILHGSAAPRSRHLLPRTPSRRLRSFRLSAVSRRPDRSAMQSPAQPSILRCPSCASPLKAEDLDAARTYARCAHCGALSSLAGVDLPPAEWQPRPDLGLPEGLVVEREGGFSKSGGDGSRRGNSSVLLFFCVAWNAFLFFWYSVALRSWRTVDHEGLSPRPCRGPGSASSTPSSPAS